MVEPGSISQPASGQGQEGEEKGKKKTPDKEIDKAEQEKAMKNKKYEMDDAQFAFKISPESFTLPPRSGVSFQIISKSVIAGDLTEKFICSTQIPNARDKRVA